jgi:hypothetical protein
MTNPGREEKSPMSWTHDERRQRHTSELGYVVTASRGSHGVTYNGWLPLQMGGGYVPRSQSNELEACKKACSDHFANAQGSKP